MIQENSKPPPIPFPSIEAGDKLYYISEIVKWIFSYDVEANDQDVDLVRIYEWLDPISFRTNLKDPSYEREFKPIKETSPDMKMVHATDNHFASKIFEISRHSKIVFSLIDLLSQNIQNFIFEVTKGIQIDVSITKEGHQGPLQVFNRIIN